MHYFDSHAHLADPQMLVDLDAMLARALGEGVVSILNICTTVEEIEVGKKLAYTSRAILNAGATPPHTVLEEGEEAFPLFARAAREGVFRAIGETGLDYHYTHAPRELQHEFLKRYLHLARETKLPVIFHCREAFEDLFAIVDQEYPKEAPAIVHCFTGTVEEAKKAVERGWFLSLSGIVTFKKSEGLREAAKAIPLSQLLIETDAPYLAPQSQRGKRNEPSFLPETAACIAAVKGISLEEVAEATRKNAERLFR